MAEKEKVMDMPLEPGDLDKLVVGRVLDIENFDKMKEHGERIEQIIHWAKLRGAKDLTGIVAEIKRAKNMLGSANIQEMVVFTGLDIQRIETVKEMNKFVK